AGELRAEIERRHLHANQVLEDLKRQKREARLTSDTLDWVLGHRNRNSSSPAADALSRPPEQRLIELPEVMKEPVPRIGGESLPMSERIKKITEHPHFDRLTEALNTLPELSALAVSEKVLLHWFISSDNMQNVLEIGTWLAGTTQVLASSMEAKGSGKV